MDTNTIRELLAQGQTRKALEALLSLIRQDARYKDNLTRTLEVLQAGYERTRQQEQKGILSFQEAQREYNKTADVVLSILNDVEAGRMPAIALRARRVPVLIGAAILVLVGVVAWLLFFKSATACPDFKEKNALHVLVFPFDALDDRSAAVEVRIQDEIRALTAKAEIPAEVEIGTRGKDDKSSLSAAESRAASCGADLVVFGQYKAFSGDSVRVKLGYRFLNKGGQSGDTPFVTYRDITELTAMRELQDALFSMCVAVAMHEENWEFAERWMAKIKEKDTGDMRLAQWMANKREK